MGSSEAEVPRAQTCRFLMVSLRGMRTPSHFLNDQHSSPNILLKAYFTCQQNLLYCMAVFLACSNPECGLVSITLLYCVLPIENPNLWVIPLIQSLFPLKTQILLLSPLFIPITIPFSRIITIWSRL